MKVVLQRVKEASVKVNNEVIARIGTGCLLLVGFEQEDHSNLLQPMIDKIKHLKLFPDEKGRFALSLEEVVGSLLIVSQFTLSAELKKGKKPSFSKALEPEGAETLYDEFVNLAEKAGIPVQTGTFGALMQVVLQNDGPVTILMDSRTLFPSLHKR
ncbi:MAG: D-tyrosyl-tRNA(Tyr) deacylase [Proteobacteria bacterium]|nr:D-tyrosyl-tRNA(Tyr) deacylase [Pseudomonadota bacterium]